MTRPNRPSFQQTVAGLNDRVGVPGGGGGIQSISPVLQVILDASDVVREIRWSRFVHTMVGADNVRITFDTVPQGEVHQYLFIGADSGGSGPETWVVRAIYPAQGLLPSDSDQKTTLQSASEGSLLATKPASDPGYGHEYQPLNIYPGGHLEIDTESALVATKNVTLDLLWEILPAPARAFAEVVTPTVVEF